MRYLALILISMLSAFTLGTMVDDHTQKTVINQTEDMNLGYTYVNYTGDFYAGRYHFHFRENMSERLGYTYPEDPRNDIYIETDRSAEGVINTCRHEILHHYFPEYRHPENVNIYKDPIHRLEDNVEFAVCKQMMRTVKRQNS